MNVNGFSDLLPFCTNVCLLAHGRWGGGGAVAITQDGHTRTLLLPPALFDLLATFMSKACEGSTEAPASELCPAATFLNARELCSALRQRTRGTANPLDPDPPNLAKYVYRLRRALSIPNLLEHERHLGYRLSTPPRNLTLFLVGETTDKHH